MKTITICTRKRFIPKITFRARHVMHILKRRFTHKYVCVCVRGYVHVQNDSHLWSLLWYFNFDVENTRAKEHHLCGDDELLRV